MDLSHIDLVRVHWLAVYWTIITLYGATYTIRNVWVSRNDWLAVSRARSKQPLIIQAFTPVRTHLLVAAMHLILILFGIVGILTPTPPGQDALPNTLYGWALSLIALSIPHLLIAMSYTIHRDRGRVIQSLAAGD